MADFGEADVEDADVEEENTESNITLGSAVSNKVSVIKAVRAATGLGLLESKDLVEGAMEAINKGEVDAAKAMLEEAGAGTTVELINEYGDAVPELTVLSIKPVSE